MVEMNKELEDFVNNSKWRFAKTMAKMPHSYIVKENVDPKLFEELVLYIREHGEEREFRIYSHRKMYTYLDYNKYEYWTMGAPLEETIIINKALKKDDNL